MVKIRLKRIGRKHSPFYNIVAADSRSPRSGRFIEKLGLYDPISKTLELKEEELKTWLKDGAQPTEPVLKILQKSIDEVKKPIDFKSKPLSVARTLKKQLVSLIQKNLKSRAEKPSDLVINAFEMYNSNPDFKKFIELLKNKEPVISLTKLYKMICDENDEPVKFDKSINKKKLYTLDEIKSLNLFSNNQLEKVEKIMNSNNLDMTGILKQLKFQLSDSQYKSYMSKNRYLKNSPLPEKKHILLNQFLYNHNINRLLFDINKPEA